MDHVAFSAQSRIKFFEILLGAFRIGDDERRIFPGQRFGENELLSLQRGHAVGTDVLVSVVDGDNLRNGAENRADIGNGMQQIETQGSEWKNCVQINNPPTDTRNVDFNDFELLFENPEMTGGRFVHKQRQFPIWMLPDEVLDQIEAVIAYSVERILQEQTVETDPGGFGGHE
jgi:hypothetical protein